MYGVCILLSLCVYIPRSEMTSSLRKVKWSNDPIGAHSLGNTMRLISDEEITELQNIFNTNAYVRAHFGTLTKHLIGGVGAGFTIGNAKWAAIIDMSIPRVADLWKTWCLGYLRNMVCFGFVLVAIRKKVPEPLILDPSLFRITITVDNEGIPNYTICRKDVFIPMPYRSMYLFEVDPMVTNPAIESTLNSMIAPLKQITHKYNTDISCSNMANIKKANPLTFTTSARSAAESAANADLFAVKDQQSTQQAQRDAKNANTIQVSSQHTRAMIKENARQDASLSQNDISRDRSNGQRRAPTELAEKSFAVHIHALPEGHAIVQGPPIDAPRDFEKTNAILKGQVANLTGVPESFLGDTGRSALAADLTSLMTFRCTIKEQAARFQVALEHILVATYGSVVDSSDSVWGEKSLEITFPSTVDLETLIKMWDIGAVDAETFRKYAPNATGISTNDINPKRMEEQRKTDREKPQQQQQQQQQQSEPKEEKQAMVTAKKRINGVLPPVDKDKEKKIATATKQTPQAPAVTGSKRKAATQGGAAAKRNKGQR